jgi:anti-sigma factor RsiW
MVCEDWRTKLDTHLDGELPEQEMFLVDTHVRSCSSCSADALMRTQLKRAIHATGRRFGPSTKFRKRIEQRIASRPQHSLRLGWIFASATVAMIAVGTLTSAFSGARSGRDHVFSEITDLHVAALASSSPVDVISTDRHTVKPWFQGKIPFAFDLPDLRNTEFTLLGGRMTYLDQTPGAHLIYDLRKHHISVFVFRERSLPRTLDSNFSSWNRSSFRVETWTLGGLRFFVIGDVGVADIDSLAKLFRTAAS